MSPVFRVFPNDPEYPVVKSAQGPYVCLEDGRRILDATAGGTHYAVLGWNDADINLAIQDQLERFSHVDYKTWLDPNLDDLARLLLSRAGNGLDKVYFSGSSGSEACEAAMKMSYQAHFDSGKTSKRWFISREQSYHGSTSDALALGERPNLEFFRPMLSPFRARVSMHHPFYNKLSDESLESYSSRCADELDAKIKSIGSENVAGFVGETMMGGLVGDVPPAPQYWKYIRQVCDDHDVHLILDEVYCGTGTSGKIFCCDWDEVRPDFLFVGKTLAAGYGVLSVVFTTSEIEKIIKTGQGRLQHTTTFQAHSLSVAAALAVQSKIHDDEMLFQVREIGEHMRSKLVSELGSHEFFREVRGRGLRFSIEYDCENRAEFSTALGQSILENHAVMVSAKWHRTSFTPPLIINWDEANKIVDAFCEEFRILAKDWSGEHSKN